MNKHVLMLTAATVALMAGPASAADYSSITTKITDPVKTSTAANGSPSDIDIGSGGSVEVSTGAAAVTIDSPNKVSLSTSGSLVSNKGTSSAIGIQMDGSTTGNGPTAAGALALDSYGSIDLTGSGSSKTGILITAPDGTGDIFNGGIKLETGSTLNVTGDSSYGIHSQAGSTLKGDVTILGSLLAAPSSTSSLTSGSVTGVQFDGAVNGNVSIGTGGQVQATGYAARGMVINGAISGALTNYGTLSAVGTTTPSTTGSNPEASTALSITGGIAKGLLNAGPSTTDGSIAAATISEVGTGNAVAITAPTSAITLGPVSDTTNPGYSFLNRGNITARSQDADFGATTVSIVGGPGSQVTFDGGLYNSGSITATSAADAKASTYYNATALTINYATLNATPSGAIAAIYNTKATGSGSITASVSGLMGGNAKAIEIGSNANVPSLYNDGTISASATSTDTTITNPLTAYAIDDQSGTLVNITNAGTISATATTLDSGNQVAIALNLPNAKSGVTITNTGTITGDINLGAFNDTLYVSGPGGGSASVTGNINFGGGTDTLNIGTGPGTGTVTGKVIESGGGRVNVNIGGNGTLTLQNTSKALVAGTLNVQDGGTLNLSLSNGLNQQANSANPAVVYAHTVNFSQLSTLKVSFGSFISAPNGSATFTLFDADTALNINNASVIANSVQIPYLFTGSLCTYNVGVTGIANCGTPTSADQQLVLTLTPKTAAQVGLMGSAAAIYPYANAALAKDDVLGGAVISSIGGVGVSDAQAAVQAQDVYSAFVPDISGSSRAVAISLTDQATGMVAARQRALRMYAAKPGGTTMWGQEFVQRLNSSAKQDGYRASGFGFALGADGGSPTAGRYGLAFTFFSGDQTNKAANFDKTTNQWYMLTGYSDWRGKGLFLDTQLTFGYSKLTGKRSIALTDASGNAVNRTASGKRSGLLAAGGLSTGAVFTYGGTVLTPQFSLDGLTMREGGYTETGGGAGFDLHVHPYYANSLRAYLGGSLRQDIDWGGYFVQPSVRVGYRYDLLADPVKLKASFASIGNTFTLTGPDPERGDVVASAGLAVTTGNWSLGVHYDYVRGNKGGVDQTGTLTLVGRL